MDNDPIQRAKEFALKAHQGQRYGDHPYGTHLEHVQRILIKSGHSNEESLVMASWLHDTVEDTETTIDEISAKFGPTVADIVFRVTDEAGNTRAERKKKTYPKIKGHREATIVKLCDRIANVESSFLVPDKFAMYAEEYKDFRAELYIPQIADDLWRRLDEAMGLTCVEIDGVPEKTRSLIGSFGYFNLIFYEDAYETTFGDGEYWYPHAVTFDDQEAENFIQRQPSAIERTETEIKFSYRFHLMRVRIWLSDGNLCACIRHKSQTYSLQNVLSLVGKKPAY